LEKLSEFNLKSYIFNHPVYLYEQDSQSNSTSTQHIKMDKARILVVEDEPIIGMEIENRLQNFGYEVVSVVDNSNSISEEAASASEELSGQAMELQAVMRRFKLSRTATGPGSVQAFAPTPAVELVQRDVAAQKAETDGEPQKMIMLDDDNFGKY
jgi:CheY-like chemotaxis protein